MSAPPAVNSRRAKLLAKHCANGNAAGDTRAERLMSIARDVLRQPVEPARDRLDRLLKTVPPLFTPKDALLLDQACDKLLAIPSENTRCAKVIQDVAGKYRPADDSSVAGDITPAAQQQRAFADESDGGDYYPTATIAELSAATDTLWLVHEMIEEETVVSVVAPKANLKTAFLLHLALSVAAGILLWGRVVLQGAVVYVYAEGGRNGAARRINAFLRAAHLMPDLPILFIPTRVPITDPRAVTKLLATIDHAAIAKPIRLVVIDTLARCFDGNENATEDMNAFVAGCDRIREALRCTFAVAHHAGWEGTRSRGASSWPGAVDTQIHLKREKDLLTVHCETQRNADEFKDFVLETFPVEKAFVLRLSGLEGKKMPQSRYKTLACLDESRTLTRDEWQKSAKKVGVERSTFYECAKLLPAFGYVIERDEEFGLTSQGKKVKAEYLSRQSRSVQTSNPD